MTISLGGTGVWNAGLRHGGTSPIAGAYPLATTGVDR